MKSREIEHVDDRCVFASGDREQWRVRFFSTKLHEMMTLVTDAVPYAYEAAARTPYDGYRHHLHHHHHHHHHPHPHRYRRVYAPTESEYLQEGYIATQVDADDRARLIDNNALVSAGSLNYRNDRIRWGVGFICVGCISVLLIKRNEEKNKIITTNSIFFQHVLYCI